MAIAEDTPVDVSWSTGPIKQNLLVSIKPETEKGYPLTVTLKVFAEGRQNSSSMTGGTYELDKGITDGELVSTLIQRLFESETVHAFPSQPCSRG
jgi:hypothetical protein